MYEFIANISFIKSHKFSQYFLNYMYVPSVEFPFP